MLSTLYTYLNAQSSKKENGLKNFPATVCTSYFKEKRYKALSLKL